MKALWRGSCKAKNNAEYRAVLKKRLVYLWITLLAGFIAAALGLIIFLLDILNITAFQSGILFGMGIGLILGSIIGMIRIYTTLSSEEKLKESRLKETDERELEVNSKALRMTAWILLVCLYILMLVGGLFEPIIMNVCSLLIGIFLISYTLLRFYYQKTM
ncbi:MAG TPA: hypothetical protein VJY54_10825 [Lachnospiraceae bacterium]|nr:hypothetical protein [Lachnospiraceae bacterium]